jgi:hypothetical protein
MDSNSDGYCSKLGEVSEEAEENKVECLEPWWALVLGIFAVKIQGCPSLYLSPQGCRQK